MYQRIKDNIRERLLTIKVKDLYNTIDEDDIFKKIGVEWTVGGKPISPQELQQLRVEAKMFANSRLWRYMQNDIKYRANKKMYEKAVSKDDLVAGKLWLYTLDAFKTFINNLTE